jgi:alkylated DNA repair protein (DNA oxidative demethylase)
MMSKGAPPGFLYFPDFLSLHEQVEKEVRALSYSHDLVRGRPLKRGYAQFGHAYDTTSRRLTAAPPIPPVLQAAIRRVAFMVPELSESIREEPTTPYYPTDLLFTQCIVTRYPPGAGIGWHTDAPQFGGWILGLSLASAARLQFRRAQSQNVSFEVIVSPGSLYVLCGEARWLYQHQIVPVKAERYSLTFRSVTSDSELMARWVSYLADRGVKPWRRHARHSS